jgi:hypothetical protein
MCEIDIEADNGQEARSKAMDTIHKNHYGMMFPDIKQIALTFDDDNKGDASGLD